jgi:hypothetical protein
MKPDKKHAPRFGASFPVFTRSMGPGKATAGGRRGSFLVFTRPMVLDA